jgi:hypothetical protein
MTDYWPHEEGLIVDGFSIANAYANAAIEAFEVVHAHTSSTAGEIVVAPAAADADGYAVALKAATAQGDIIPVLYFGIVKFPIDEVIAEDDTVENDAVGTHILPIDTDNTAANYSKLRAINYTGTEMRLGIALQGGNTDDEILVLVGRIY